MKGRGGKRGKQLLDDRKEMRGYWKLKGEALQRMRGTRCRSRLRHHATSQKVAGSISDGVTGIFHWHNSSGLTMALGLTQSLREMNTRNIFWGVKAAGVYGWQPYYLHVPTVMKSRRLKLLESPGSVQACNGIAVPFSISHAVANRFGRSYESVAKQSIYLVHRIPNKIKTV